MTPLQIALAASGALLWLAAGAAIAWSCYALLTGRRTVSGLMAAAPRWAAFLFGLLVGAVAGLLAGHWWWPTVGN